MSRARKGGLIAAVIGVGALIALALSSEDDSGGGGGGDMSGADGLSPIRQRVVQAALGAVGLNATDRTTEFEDFLGGPGESDVMKRGMALSPQSSTCGLVARAILRTAGFTDPRRQECGRGRRGRLRPPGCRSPGQGMVLLGAPGPRPPKLRECSRNHGVGGRG